MYAYKNNKKSGNSFEREFSRILFDNGFYAHLNAPKVDGSQPFDVQACKNNVAYQFDCKVCHEDYFRLKNIRPNQQNAFNLLKICGCENNFIAINFVEHGIKLVNYESIDFSKKKIFYEDAMDIEIFLEGAKED